MPWQVLIILQTFAVSLGFLAMRAIARQKVAANASFVIIATQSLLIYPLVVLGLLFVPHLHLDFAVIKHYYWLVIANGLLYGLGNVAIYKVYSKLDAGFSSILNTLITVTTVFFANLILHEKLTPQEVFGSIILLAAVSYATLIARQHHKRKKDSQAWLWGLLFAVLSSLPYGLAQITEKFLLNKTNVATYITFSWGSQMVVAMAIALLVQPRAFKVLRDKSILRLNIFGALARGLAGFLFLLALSKSNSISLVGIVTNFRIVIIVLLGAVVLKERQRLPQKLLAASIAIAGLSVIFWN